MNNVQQHPTALVQSNRIGERTRVWAWVNILPGAVIGSDCNICDRVFLENDVRIGDRVTIKCGVSLWDGVTIEDDVFIGPGATFTNDLHPRSRKHLSDPVRTLVRRGASIGANATILAGVTVGMHAMVGAGAVVTRDVPPYAIVVGNPARIKGYVSSPSGQPSLRAQETPDSHTPAVRGVNLVELPRIIDMRGSLSVAETGKQLPFEPKRYFLVFDVPSAEIRGEHAHKKLHQFLVCVHGRVNVLVDDGTNRDEYVLDRPNLGLHVPPMVWATQYKYGGDAVLLVLASETYSAEDYIRNYDEYLEAVQRATERCVHPEQRV